MRRKLKVKLLAGVLGSLVAAAVVVHFLHGFQVQRNAHQLLERGDRAVEAKDHDKALAYYGQYLTLVPNDVDGVQKYVLLLDRSSAAERVSLVLRMEQVLRVKPGEHALRFRLVENLIALGRYAEAIDHLKKLENHWPDQADLLHMIGWCQDAKKDYEAAALSFEAAVRLKPTQIKSYALLAEMLNERLNQPDDAHKVLDDLVRNNGAAYQAYLLRARFLRRRGNETSAESDLQMAVKLGPTQADVLLEAADAARARGNRAEAAKLLQDGIQRFPDSADFYRALAYIHLLDGNQADALAAVAAGLRRAPKSIELAVLFVDLSIDQKNNRAARDGIDDLVKAKVKPGFTNYLKARLAFTDRQWHEAIRLLESARPELRAAPEWSSRANLLLGLSYRQVGARDQELQALRRAVNDEPTWMTANVELGAALLSHGRVDEAGQALEPLRTAKDLPAGYWILLSRARLARELRLPEAERRWDDVDEALEQAVKTAPKSVEVALLAGSIYELEGKHAQAIESYTRALELGDLQPRVLASLLRLLLQRREFSKAEAEIVKHEKKSPLTPELARLGVEVAQGLRDAKLALKRAEQAVLPVRDYRDTLWLARISDAAGANAKAEELLRTSLDQAGHTPDTWIAWMEHLWHTNQREHGVKDLERLKKELPASRQPLAIARCYEALQMPDQAAKAYQAALAQAPDDFLVLSYAADFARRAERADDAQRWYERLLDPVLAAPADYTAPARRQLAVLLAPRDEPRALALLGDTLADQRVRWFIQSLVPSARLDALKQFDESLQQRPASAEERFLLAQMLESANRLPEARTLLAELADDHPTAGHFLARYARLLIRMGELDEAARRIARLETLEPGSQRVRDLRAELARFTNPER